MKNHRHAHLRGSTVVFLSLVVIAALTLAGCGSDETPEAAPKVELPDFTGLVKHVSPAVVNISALAAEDDSEPDGGIQPGDAPDDSDSPLEGWLRRFFDQHPDRGEVPDPMPRGPNGAPRPSMGSGFIISSDGYILTNRHVVDDAGQIVVKLNDRRQLVASVVGEDRYSDLAVLKVGADDLPTVRIGDPSKLDVGSWVVAIGSPFGFETSVTAGIVSAKQRSLATEQYVPFLQTDVAINPGNSGGPLFDLSGEVVGINSQIYSRTGGYQGVSFAIPIDIAMDVAKQLRNGDSVTRGWLGVQIQDVDRQLAKSFGLKRPEGALVARVMPDSPAQGAGLEAGDVILAFNGKAVVSASALPPLVGTVPPGESATIRVLRNGERRDIDVDIEKLPKDLRARRTPSRGSDEPSEQRSSYGLTLESLDTQARRALDLDQGGVKVTDVAAGAGREAGLAPGDVILAIGSTNVEDARSLRQALEAASGPVALLVLRDGSRLYLPMEPSGDD